LNEKRLPPQKRANKAWVRPDKSSSAHWWKSSSGKGQAATRSEQATDAVG